MNERWTAYGVPSHDQKVEIGKGTDGVRNIGLTEGHIDKLTKWTKFSFSVQAKIETPSPLSIPAISQRTIGEDTASGKLATTPAPAAV